jgi:hypothetical protein
MRQVLGSGPPNPLTPHEIVASKLRIRQVAKFAGSNRNWTYPMNGSEWSKKIRFLF